MKNNQRIKVILAGGLGNQFFQFFAAIKLAEISAIRDVEISRGFFSSAAEPRKFDLEKCVDFNSEYFSDKGITISVSENAADQALFKLGVRVPGIFCNIFGICNDKTGPFIPVKSALLVGYHQSIDKIVERQCVRSVLKSKFGDRQGMVAVHIRRGDYLVKKNSKYGTVDPRTIIDLLRSNDSFDCNVIFFSDSDIKGEVTSLLSKSERCSVEFASELGLDTIGEFFLMRSASRIICSNSTFSWWAAYSSAAADHILIPDEWMKNFPTPEHLVFAEAATYKAKLI